MKIQDINTQIDEWQSKEFPYEEDFSVFASIDEIADYMVKKTSEQLVVMGGNQTLTFALARLQYLLNSSLTNFYTLVDLYHEGELLNHAVTIEQKSRDFIEEKMKKMMIERNITEELKQSNPEEYKTQMNNLYSILEDQALIEIVEEDFE